MELIVVNDLVASESVYSNTLWCATAERFQPVLKYDTMCTALSVRNNSAIPNT